MALKPKSASFVNPVTAPVQGPCDDARLRKFGFAIHSRPKVGSAVWMDVETKHFFKDSEARMLANRRFAEFKASGKKSDDADSLPA